MTADKTMAGRFMRRAATVAAVIIGASALSFGFGASGVSAQATAQKAAQRTVPGPVPGYAKPTPGLNRCVARLRAQAVKSGISRALARRALGKVAFSEKAVRFSRRQPERVIPIWDYMAFLVDPQRIKDGRARLKQHDKTLRAVERKFGVDRYVLTALWGVESDYGRVRGEFFLPHALANVICAGFKRKFFHRELMLALKLVQRGDIELEKLQGSWAGAFGQTQFLPSTYRRAGVDFDGDGRRDLVSSVPDALASAARFLQQAGWRRGQSWGLEVRVPKTYSGPRGRRARARLAVWAKRGVVAAGGEPLKGKRRAALLQPAGRNGPAFLVYRNFWALYSYNVAIPYALAISHLSDRLRGKGAFKTPWPTDDPGLTRAQRLELQKRLIRAGYDIGEADGKIGPVTTAALKRAQAKLGLKPDGRPGLKTYRALKHLALPPKN